MIDLDFAIKQGNILLQAMKDARRAAIEDFANRLLKKIFPYDGLVDKKTYAINAQAVKKAIEDTIKEVDNG